MANDTARTLRGWRFGLHPAAAGASVRSMERLELEIGDALRIEMGTPGSDDTRHVQYFIATSSGGWAMWISGSPADLVGHDASIAAMKPPEDVGADDDVG